MLERPAPTVSTKVFPTMTCSLTFDSSRRAPIGLAVAVASQARLEQGSRAVPLTLPNLSGSSHKDRLAIDDDAVAVARSSYGAA